MINSRVEKYFTALADRQEGFAQHSQEKLPDEEQRSTAAGPVNDQSAPEARAPSTPPAHTLWAANMTTQPNQAPVSSPAAIRLAATVRLAAAKNSLPAAKADEESSSSPKPSSLIQMFEGREDELMLWLGIAVTFFIVGWICGGNFYVRRDRNRRRKLRF